MSGRDSLPHFPAPGKGQQQGLPSTHSQSQERMYPQQQYQQSGGVPGAYPPAGYQVGPPGTGYGGAQQTYQAGFSASASISTQQQSVPQGVDPQLYALFKSADVNNSGRLSERELSRALVNGDWTPFDAKTIKLMVKMFDTDLYSLTFLCG